MAVPFIICRLRILLQIVTNDSDNISDMVFRQTAISHNRTFPTSESSILVKKAHITIFVLFSIGNHSEEWNAKLYSVTLEMLKQC